MHNALGRIREELLTTDLDGWLIYDFRGSNPLARTLLGLPERAHLTRRYFVWVPRRGAALVLHHRIEESAWNTISQGSARLEPYSSHQELDAALQRLLAHDGLPLRIAMEYSPRGDVPYVSFVDAGTLERVRATGAEIVSSADLLQAFLKWTSDDLAAHQRAVSVLMRAKDAAFQLIHERLLTGEAVTELDVQTVIMQQIQAGKLITDHPAIVGFGENAANPHYAPDEANNATLSFGQCVLIDLWGQESGRPHADVTWMAHAGPMGEEFMLAWTAVADARDLALQKLSQEWGELQGWQIDRAARQLLEERGFGSHFTHRLGHNLGEALHGPGANLDDLETHDTRRLTGGLAVTVEPGVYPKERGYGIRSEVNVYFADQGPQVTTPIQRAPYVLGLGRWEDVQREALHKGTSA
ncbi:M24 family metallopeptidase [Deinococcus peraridilitoris]|uniref:Xaa-Pro aminopeptidase n=1 Tax=Deinococcus peraridilitoris (strain DSM 19664 / LMG 22246 / CIP 109416 / KR-200) TaxID=937777 RepID=K9ZYN3_DEIPD|nr:M24 family metallopeptidase [Deinococcus peraridilitoris]AFZ66686.1 Xaa-Pro aminopeptidase [Deinococcus peraridilitoris DSM 19664]